jgi:signal transduction histidine kinase
MKKFTCCFILLLCSFYTYAQSNHKLDSLKKVLAKLPKEGTSFGADTMRVRVLVEMGEVMINRDSALSFFKSASRISENNNFLKGNLKLNLKLNAFYSEQPLKRLEFLMKALAVSESLKDFQKQIEITINIKSRFDELEDYTSGLKYAFLHSELCQKHGTQKQYILSLNSIGISYFALKNYKMALKYFELCQFYNQSLKSNQIENVALINIAKVRVIEKKYDEALISLKKALVIDDGYNDRVPFVTNEIAQIYLNQGKNSEALIFAKKAEFASKNRSIETSMYISKTLHEIYKKLNNKVLAYEYLENYSNMKLREDSIKNSKLITFINLDYKNEKQFQEINQLTIQKKEQEEKSRLLGYGVIASIITLSIILFFYNSLKNKNTQIENQKTEIEDLNKNLEIKVDKRTLELKVANEELIRKNHEITEALFKGQSIERKRVAVELHDNLGGTLSAIKWRLEALNGNNLSEKERKIYDSILGMMHNAYSEVRHISHNLLPAEFEEKGLIGALEKLINDINQSQKLQIRLVTDGQIEGLDNKIALELYGICMELVNNILKHSQATKAEILFSNQKRELKLFIRDNGIGLLNGQNSDGMGLKNLNNRLETIGGKVEVSKSELWNTEINIEVYT